MTYSQLFLNSRGKIPPQNYCFRPVFELRHSLIRRAMRLWSKQQSWLWIKVLFCRKVS